MGKKKPQKTKELSVAIAQASLTGGDEAKQQQSQPHTPKKRGRPRKIIEEQSSTKLEQESVAAVEEESKKAKVSEKEEEDEPKESEIKRAPSRSRARRKSKPRKSSC